MVGWRRKRLTFAARFGTLRRMDTFALDPSTWDLTTDASGNLATFGGSTPGDATGPGIKLAQDVATRCQSWLGEVYYDTTQGIQYDQVLGGAPNLPLLQAAMQREALNVPGCATAIANFAFTRGAQRRITGSLTVSDANGATGVVQF
jgi:hypothetical protein